MNQCYCVKGGGWGAHFPYSVGALWQKIEAEFGFTNTEYIEPGGAAGL